MQDAKCKLLSVRWCGDASEEEDEHGDDRFEIRRGQLCLKICMFTAVEGYWSFLIARVILGSSIHIVFSVFYVLVQVKPSQYASKVSVRVEAFDGSFSFAFWSNLHNMQAKSHPCWSSRRFFLVCLTTILPPQPSSNGATYGSKKRLFASCRWRLIICDWSSCFE